MQLMFYHTECPMQYCEIVQQADDFNPDLTLTQNMTSE